MSVSGKKYVAIGNSGEVASAGWKGKESAIDSKFKPDSTEKFDYAGTVTAISFSRKEDRLAIATDSGNIYLYEPQ